MIKHSWSKDEIALAILRLYADGEPLNYASVEKQHVALLRAATRYFGSWRAAIEYAGLDYEQIRRYKVWTEERIISAIRHYHRQGKDLSWRHVSTTLDPPLAAAALRNPAFRSWEAALEAAGLDYDTIRRYRSWDEESIARELRRMARQGMSLRVTEVNETRPDLVAAARRYFNGWYEALKALGIDNPEAAPAARASDYEELAQAADD